MRGQGSRLDMKTPKHLKGKKARFERRRGADGYTATCMRQFLPL